LRKTVKRTLAYLLAFSLVFGIMATENLFGVVAQAATDPDGYTIIKTATDLDTVVRNNLSGKYRLGADIDLSQYAYTKSTWTATNGWNGIGSSLAAGFSGTFDGNGYTIKGLWSKDRGSNQGLFSWLNKATIKNLTIELSASGITGAGERKGALAGNAYNGTVIENCKAIGSQDTVTAGSKVIDSCKIIDGCKVIDNCKETESQNGSPISGSANYIAGLVGVVYQSQIRSSSVENINCSGFSYVAGFAGVAYGVSTIADCYATGSASADGSYPGGFIGALYGASTISNSYATGNVSAKLAYAGGFAGAIYEGSRVEYSHATGTVYAKGSYVGGFAAVLYGAKGSSMFRCYAFGDVRSDVCYAGGLLGDLYDNSSIEECCAYGNVSANAYCVGGLVGEVNRGTIKNCYAQGNVSGTTGTGGLVGYFSAAYGTSAPYNYAENCYSSGTVSGSGKLEQGAFSGMTTVKFNGTNYYDSTKNAGLQAYGTSVKPINIGGNSLPQGKDTATMMKQATFVGWNFDTIWGIEENKTYPYFVWMPGHETRTVTGFVYPMVTDDRGLGEDFLHKHDITVELRATFQTPAPAGLSTQAVWTGTEDMGMFTITNVPYGEYLLYIKRPGYLTRCMPVTISANDPKTVALAPPNGATAFELWAGDVNADWEVNGLDLSIVLHSIDLQINAQSPDYNPSCDFNADGFINDLDMTIATDNLDKTVLQYPGAENVDPYQ